MHHGLGLQVAQTIGKDWKVVLEDIGFSIVPDSDIAEYWIVSEAKCRQNSGTLATLRFY